MPLLVHGADAHTGYQQYGSEERRKDFALAFAWLVHEAISRRATALLFAGDLFNDSTPDLQTLWETTLALEALKQKGISFIVIKGNHDRHSRPNRLSGLDYLAKRRLVMLLESPFENGEVDLYPWSELAYCGSYIDLPGRIRIIGAQYQGAKLPKFVPALARALKDLEAETSPQPFTILLMHAGVEGVLPYVSGGLSQHNLAELCPFAHCLALGHIHMPFNFGGWIYNPGSLETCAANEADWADRGYLLIDVDQAKQRMDVAQIHHAGRREFARFTHSVDGYLDPQQLYAGLHQQMVNEASWSEERVRPVLELRLQGVLQFPRAALDLVFIKQMLVKLFNPIVCRVKDLTQGSDVGILLPQETTRAETEYQVVRELVERDVRRKKHSTDWTAGILELRTAALRKTAPEQMIAEVHGLLQAEE